MSDAKEGRCIVRVWAKGMFHQHQCARKNGFGPNGEFCYQHSPEAVAKREEEKTKRFEMEQRRRAAPFNELQLLRSRLTIAEETLNAIGGHPACDYSADPEYYSDDKYQRYMGIKQGHKACATIAREGLKRMEEVK